MTGAEATPVHLDWPGCRNVRDLGGLPTRDGRKIRERALIRSDALDRLTPEGVALVRALGVSRIVDLRRPVEVQRKPHPFGAEPSYRNIPVQNPADPDHEWLELAEIYIAMLDLRPRLFAQAVGAVADAPPGPVVVHCAGGKDRTGLIVAMALVIAGVEEQVITADYALTEARMREENIAHLEAIQDPRRREIAARLQPTPPENMLRVLGHLDDKYGGVAAYLRSGGLDQAALTALRDRLVA